MFKVYPVQMVAKPPKLKRENRGAGHRRRSSSDPSPFGELLESAMREAGPTECHTVTYTADRQLKTYSYRYSVEYTF